MDERARCRGSRFPVRALRRRRCGNRCSGRSLQPIWRDGRMVKDVGATVVVALLPADAAREPGDQGSPLQLAMLEDAGPRRISEVILLDRRKNEFLPSPYTQPHLTLIVSCCEDTTRAM